MSAGPRAPSNAAGSGSPAQFDHLVSIDAWNGHGRDTIFHFYGQRLVFGDEAGGAEIAREAEPAGDVEQGEKVFDDFDSPGIRSG